MCLTPEESMATVVDEHFPDNRDAPHVNILPRGTVTEVDTSDSKADFMSDERVKEAIRTFGPHKAPGPDGFKPCVYQNFGDKATTRLVSLYKASYLLGYVPKIWRLSKVIFLPKPGKADYSQARAFRPITLAPFVIKAMERTVLWYIEEQHLGTNPLHCNQHAFRKGKSTESALTDFVSKVEKALAKREHALGVCLDIQGAFDNVKSQAVIQGMEA